ncbi:MAG TPA: hypothetical protein V6D11_19370 [Waterburya sp.]|jgi:hypothetical protein
MSKEKLFRIANLSLLIGSTFILCAVLGMLLNPNAFYKFFSPVQLVPDPFPPSRSISYYWDVRSYAQMALTNRCLAFYPLWPLLGRILFHPQNLDQAAHSLLKLATVISLASIPFFVWGFIKTLKHQYLAVLVLLAFAVNPMAIFRSIGYTESLFSALSMTLILLCLRPTRLNESINLALVFAVTFFMSLSRPILIPVFFSSSAALGTIFFFEFVKLETREWRNFSSKIIDYAQEIRLTVTLCISALFGYSIYGFFCWQTRGDFFAPFRDQSLWKTKLGLHLELLLFPKSPLIDLLGLYFPILILGLALILVYFKLKQEAPLVWVPQSPLWNALYLYPPLLILSYIGNYFRLKQKPVGDKSSLIQLNTANLAESLSSNYIFWFCVYFSVAHSAVIFLTRDRLVSLGRYIFGVPFFFIALGYLCCCIPGKKTYQALWWFIILSAVALVQQWVTYGHSKWLG